MKAGCPAVSKCYHAAGKHKLRKILQSAKLSVNANILSLLCRKQGLWCCSYEVGHPVVVVLLLCTGLLLLDVLSRRASVIELSGQELKAKVDKRNAQKVRSKLA